MGFQVLQRMSFVLPWCLHTVMKHEQPELEGSSVTGETHLSPSRRFKKLINSHLKVREPVNHQVADINNQRILPYALVKNRETLYKLLGSSDSCLRLLVFVLPLQLASGSSFLQS